MTTPQFVWFDNRSQKTAPTIAFYEALLDWKTCDSPPGMTMFAGEKGPWSGVSEASEAIVGWVPYVEVKALDEVQARAEKLGASVIQPRTKGPAGDYVVVRDPGGATFALWQRA